MNEDLIYLVLYEVYSPRREQLQPRAILLGSPEFEIDTAVLNGHLGREVEALQLRDDSVRDLALAIVEKGFTYELLFQSVLGVRDIKSASATIEAEALEECLDHLEVRTPTRRFDDFFAAFASDNDEIVVSEVLKEAERIKAGVGA